MNAPNIATGKAAEPDADKTIAEEFLRDCYRLLNDAPRFRTKDGLDSYDVAARLARHFNE
jgi:hypothetical protein